MAKCGFCAESGWFLRTSEQGLCDACAQAWSWETYATAHFITAPMRWRTRPAVTRLVDQMGSTTAMTSAVVTKLGAEAGSPTYA